LLLPETSISKFVPRFHDYVIIFQTSPHDDVSGRSNGNCSSPVVPARTSSIHPRPVLICKGETFRFEKYLN
jgi:hypothetical protein